MGGTQDQGNTMLCPLRGKETSHLGLRGHSRVFSVPTSYNFTKQPPSIENNLNGPKELNILVFFLEHRLGHEETRKAQASSG